MKIASNELVTEIQTAPTLRNVTLLAELVKGEASHFPHGTEASALGRDTESWLDDYRQARRNPFTPATSYPDTAELINLHDRLCALVTARLANSDTLSPLVEPSVSVTLWGTNADDAAEAWEVAARTLGTRKVTLVDNTHVHQADRIGIRYVFRAVSA